MNDSDKRPSQSALELRLKQVTRYTTLGLVGVLALCALLFAYVGTVKQNEQTAIKNSQVQADQTKDSTFCSIYPNDEVCILAKKISADPTATVVPKDGEDGKDGARGPKGDQGPSGRGVASFRTDEQGSLQVTYTDGSTESVGHVVGKDGKDGKAGIDGRGILSTSLDAGNLVIHYSDGSTENVGMVLGPQGAQGAAGKDGAAGPAGPQGSPGRGIASLHITAGNTVTVSYTDGTSATAGQLTINTIKAMTCSNDTLTVTMVDGTAFSATVDCTPDTQSNITAPVTGTSTGPLK